MASQSIHRRTVGAVPTVLRVGPYRCFFFAGDRMEPPHVHVERDDHRAKLWLDRGRIEEAHQVLLRVYTRFGEGFETSDLRSARQVLALLV